MFSSILTDVHTHICTKIYAYIYIYNSQNDTIISFTGSYKNEITELESGVCIATVGLSSFRGEAATEHICDLK